MATDDEKSRLGSPAPDDADFEVACWRCSPPSPADVFAQVVRYEDNPLKTTHRSSHALCESHLAELRGDDETQVTVRESETRTVRGANQNQTLTQGASEDAE